MSCFLNYRQFAVLIFGVLSILSAGVAADEIGPNVGGGGNLRPPRAVSEETIASFLKDDVATLAAWHVQYLMDFDIDRAWIFDQLNMTSEVHDKLISGLGIFAIIAKAKIKTQRTACFDPVQKKWKDASADRKTLTLCFNIASLKQKVNEAIVYPYIFKLAMHEYTHLLGTTEPEAKGFEDVVGALMERNQHSLAEVSTFWEMTKRSWDTQDSQRKLSFTLTINNLIEQLPHLSSEGLAFALTNLRRDLSEMLGEMHELMENNHIYPLTRLEHENLKGIEARIENLQSFLKSQKGFGEFQPPNTENVVVGTPTLKRPWSGPMSLADFGQQSGFLLVALDLKGEIWDLSTGDRTAVARELTAILKGLQSLFSTASLKEKP